MVICEPIRAIPLRLRDEGPAGGRRGRLAVRGEALMPLPEFEALNKRLETVSWGLFIIMLGGFALVPSDRLPEGSWLIGIGIILLGLNAVRLAVGIRMSAVTTILGVLALVGGTGDMLGVDVPVGGLLLVLVGTAIIIRALDPRRA